MFPTFRGSILQPPGRLPSCVLAVVMYGSAGCGAGPRGDHAIDEEDLAQVGQPVTCAASLDQYPVFGPHNGGWDPNALDFTCPPHPSSSPDNSDFIAGDHFGNDIFGERGIPIVAGIAGSVIRAGNTSIGGNRVTVVDSCGWHTYYAHLDAIEPGIQVGTTVSAGQRLGTLGNTGSAISTAPHLHFSIYPETYEAGIDPFPLLETVDHTSCTQQCTPQCEGNAVVAVDCATQDCTTTGATCVDDASGPRCVDSACLGQPSAAHDLCQPNGDLGHCDALGRLTAEDCPDLAPCVDQGGPRCGSTTNDGGTGGSGGGWPFDASGIDGAGADPSTPPCPPGTVSLGESQPEQGGFDHEPEGGCSCSDTPKPSLGFGLLALDLGRLWASGTSKELPDL